MKNTTINLLIADDHHIVAQSLSMMLTENENIAIAGVVNNGAEALHFLENNEIDILLADLNMPILNGIEMLAKILERRLNVKTILLTMSDDQFFIKKAIQLGVNGYLHKTTDKQELLLAIDIVNRGGNYFSKQIIKNLGQFTDPTNVTGKLAPENIKILTKREIEIVRLIIADKNNNQIAEKLSIEPTTVETHRRNIMKKIGAKTIVGLVKWGIENGFDN